MNILNSPSKTLLTRERLVDWLMSLVLSILQTPQHKFEELATNIRLLKESTSTDSLMKFHNISRYQLDWYEVSKLKPFLVQSSQLVNINNNNSRTLVSVLTYHTRPNVGNSSKFVHERNICRRTQVLTSLEIFQTLLYVYVIFPVSIWSDEAV